MKGEDTVIIKVGIAAIKRDITITKEIKPIPKKLKHPSLIIQVILAI